MKLKEMDYLDDNIIEKEDFLCGICLQFFENPISCHECQKIFCQSCIDNYINTNYNRFVDPSYFQYKCPYCRLNFKKLKLNPILKNIFDNSKFSCPMKCGKIILYKELPLHYPECIEVPKLFICNICKEEFEIYSEEQINILDGHKFKCNQINEK